MDEQGKFRHIRCCDGAAHPSAGTATEFPDLPTGFLFLLGCRHGRSSHANAAKAAADVNFHEGVWRGNMVLRQAQSLGCRWRGTRRLFGYPCAFCLEWTACMGSPSFGLPCYIFCYIRPGTLRNREVAAAGIEPARQFNWLFGGHKWSRTEKRGH